MRKIMTGSYKNCKSGNLVSISGDRGHSASFEGKCLTILAPKKEFWRTWKDNIGKVPEEENTLFYIKEFYDKVLSQLDPEVLYQTIEDDSILLCYEENYEFCHRHLVAYYLELFLGIKIDEVSVDEKGNYRLLDRPEYLKSILEEVIKESYPMHGYTSLRAAYLCNKASAYEELKTKSKLDCYMAAANLRISADEEEKKYVLALSNNK